MSSRPLSSISVGTRGVPGNYTTGWITCIRVLTVGVMTVGAMTVGAMNVGVSTVGSMGRPRESVVCPSDGTFIGALCQGWQPLGKKMLVLNFEKEEVCAYQ